VAEYPREASQELLSFLAKYDTLRPEQLAPARERVGFRRALDGRVALRAKGGELFGVKPDMQAPGFLLLRDAEGYCFYIPPADDGGWVGRRGGLGAGPNGPDKPAHTQQTHHSAAQALPPRPAHPTAHRPHVQHLLTPHTTHHTPHHAELAQVDLSDDLVVAQLFSSGVWQELLEPLDARVGRGPGGGRGDLLRRPWHPALCPGQEMCAAGLPAPALVGPCSAGPPLPHCAG
jgi:hypothetical protein